MKIDAFFAGIVTLVAAGVDQEPMRADHSSAAEATCQMVLTALEGAIEDRLHATGLGLDRQCVEEYASFDGRVNVDVVMVRQEQVEKISCTGGRYKIRGAAARPAASKHVVYLTVQKPKKGTRWFEVSVVPSAWRDRSGRVYPISPCGVADGMLRRVSGRWTATLSGVERE